MEVYLITAPCTLIAWAGENKTLKIEQKLSWIIAIGVPVIVQKKLGNVPP